MSNHNKRIAPEVQNQVMECAHPIMVARRERLTPIVTTKAHFACEQGRNKLYLHAVASKYNKYPELLKYSHLRLRNLIQHCRNLQLELASTLE